jgi:hypothetical protein
VGIGCAVSLWLYQMNENIHRSETAFILFIGKEEKMFIVIHNIFVK